MKRMIIVAMASAFLGLVAQAEEAVEAEKKPQKEKKAKEPKAKKEKKPAAPKEKKPAAPKEKKEKQPKAKPVVEEMTIRGVLNKIERKKGEKVTVSYELTDGEGNKLRLPRPKKPAKPKEGEEAAKPIKLEDYADAAVTVTARVIKVKKGKNETIIVKELLKIEKEGGVEEVKVFTE